MRIPGSTDLAELQQCFREMQIEIEKLTTRNIDMHGMRITNAGQSVAATDYVTSAELDKLKRDIMDTINAL
jgi:hypothetical protein